MTIKTTVCAMAVALLSGTAFFPAPASAQGAPWPSSMPKCRRATLKKLFLSAVAVYDAGFAAAPRSPLAMPISAAFRDGTSTEAYSSRGYLVDSYTGYPPAPAPAYSSYDRGAVYAPGYGGNSSYDGRSVSYDGRSVAYGDGYGYRSDRYDAGYVPSGLMDVAVVPVAAVAAPASEVRSAHWSYCAARYQTFDPASDTFLASDGNRYFCR